VSTTSSCRASSRATGAPPAVGDRLGGAASRGELGAIRVERAQRVVHRALHRPEPHGRVVLCPQVRVGDAAHGRIEAHVSGRVSVSVPATRRTVYVPGSTRGPVTGPKNSSSGDGPALARRGRGGSSSSAHQMRCTPAVRGRRRNVRITWPPRRARRPQGGRGVEGARGGGR
jgi:hypothetical protein